MHIHILGICGTFMGGIAAIARAAGHTVTGCDANVYCARSASISSKATTPNKPASRPTSLSSATSSPAATR